MNCKKGDLAVLIKAEISVNVGRIVRIIESDGWDADEEFCWICEAAGTPFTGYLIDRASGAWGESEQMTMSMHASIPDAWLRPIRPGELVDEKQHNRELEAI